MIPFHQGEGWYLGTSVVRAVIAGMGVGSPSLDRCTAGGTRTGYLIISTDRVLEFFLSVCNIIGIDPPSR